MPRSSSAEPRVIEAAGCVVWRRAETADDAGGLEGPDGVEVLIVHRPAPHDDWSLPKGKLHAGESHASAAVREVFEETGVRGELGPKLGEVRYELPTGDRKHVRFWALRAEVDEGWTPGEEIDGRRWLPLDEVFGELDWSSDQSIVHSFVAQLERLAGTD